MNPLDLALTESPENINWAVLHRADCPIARHDAAIGRPVLTMMGCERMPPDDGRITRCACLAGVA